MHGTVKTIWDVFVNIIRSSIYSYIIKTIKIHGLYKGYKRLLHEMRVYFKTCYKKIIYFEFTCDF